VSDLSGDGGAVLPSLLSSTTAAGDFKMMATEGGPAGQSQSALGSVLSRLTIGVNEVADLADQLHGQANRLLGSAPTPPTAAVNKPELAGNAPLVSQIEEALERLSLQFMRVREGANRLSRLG
jgi:hypothetical protein